MPHIDPALPWGCWLRIERIGANDLYVDDETGLTYASLRAALWNGRLRMPDYNREPPSDLLEVVHAVLAASARRQPMPEEEATDLFEGSLLFRKLFHLWLSTTGLVVPGENGHDVRDLTAEGWAVLRLLDATRPYDVRRNRPSAATVQALVELGLGPEDREARLSRLEREAARWDAAFLRRSQGADHSIILSKRGDTPVPVGRTVWSLSFPTERRRDVFYDWLCLRLDRWQAWSDLADAYGSEKLTHHLLAVMASALNYEASTLLAPS